MTNQKKKVENGSIVLDTLSNTLHKSKHHMTRNNSITSCLYTKNNSLFNQRIQYWDEHNVYTKKDCKLVYTILAHIFTVIEGMFMNMEIDQDAIKM